MQSQLIKLSEGPQLNTQRCAMPILPEMARKSAPSSVTSRVSSRRLSCKTCEGKICIGRCRF
jgi:hypothetical protein